MKFTKLSLEGLVLIEPSVYDDDRGFFMESYNKKLFAQNGIDVEFVQDNYSRSKINVLRGLHFQIPPLAQDKLVRVTRGKVFDVAVDIRENSPTFGKWEGVILSENNKKIFFIPKGYAHGFVSLSDITDFEYKVSNYYSKEHERSIVWNDPDIGIKWPISEPILSEKDALNPLFSKL